MAIVLDLETIAMDGVETEPVSAPANYKDEAKIAAYIQEKQAEQVTRAGLYPWTARIVALGVIDEDGREKVHLCRNESEERIALTLVGDDILHDDERFVRPVVTFNGRNFDLPVLMARARLLDVPFPSLNLDRYRSPHIDLMDRLTFYGLLQARSLKWFCRRFGIPVDDSVGGADIAGLVAAGDWDAITAHCLSDIRLTKALAERTGYLRGGKAAA